LSKPTTVNNAIVIGLRYVKHDGSHTEDLFTVERGRQIQAFYKGSLEKVLSEYKDTHKQRVFFTFVADEPPPTTSVNTISLVKAPK
jgi:hypothetical protein